MFIFLNFGDKIGKRVSLWFSIPLTDWFSCTFGDVLLDCSGGSSASLLTLGPAQYSQKLLINPGETS